MSSYIQTSSNSLDLSSSWCQDPKDTTKLCNLFSCPGSLADVMQILGRAAGKAARSEERTVRNFAGDLLFYPGIHIVLRPHPWFLFELYCRYTLPGHATISSCLHGLTSQLGGSELSYYSGIPP